MSYLERDAYDIRVVAMLSTVVALLPRALYMDTRLQYRSS